MVHSVFSDDEGHFDKVPWTHRGGVVLVFCGEINAKNKMGGYTGWKPFAFQPAQTDMQTLYVPKDLTMKEAVPKQVNIAAEPTLMLSEGLYGDDLPMLCGEPEDGVITDPTDFTADFKHRK